MPKKQSCRSRLSFVGVNESQGKFVWGRTLLLPVVIGYLLFCGWGPAQAEVLATLDFESNSLMSWTVFTTPNGTFGGDEFPAFVQCDAGGTGHPSKCLRMKVGQIHFSPDQNPQQGCVLEFQRELAAGRLHLSARIMVTYDSSQDKRNLAAGLLEWVVDGHTVGLHDLGPIENGAVARYHLLADHAVEAGFHTIQLRISRPFTSAIAQQAPVQFVDDLMIDWSPQREESR
ncbi:MAG: hypothetical protein AB7P17_14210 [Nitrospirales bacterium]|nr:hypothetical protein [Nitrospirales bacterium]